MIISRAAYAVSWLQSSYTYTLATLLLSIFLFASQEARSHIWLLWCLAGLSTLSIFTLQKTLTFGSSLFSRRQALLVSISVLISIHQMSQTPSFHWLSLLVYPYFLYLIYKGYKKRGFFILLATQFVLVVSTRPETSDLFQDVCIPMLLLLAWVGMSICFRTNVRTQLSEALDRLDFYEREAASIALGSEKWKLDLHLEEKNKEHLAALICEREASLKNLLEILQKSFCPTTCAVYLFDPCEEVFILKEYVTQSKDFSIHRIQPCEGIFRVLRRDISPIHLTSDANVLRSLTYYQNPVPVFSVVAVPFKSENLLKGALIIDHHRPNFFSQDSIQVISQIAKQLARTIDTSEILQAYFQLKEEFASFYEASSALNRSLKVNDVIQTLLDFTQKIVPYDLGVLVSYDSSTQTNRVVAETGRDQSGWMGNEFTCRPERGLISWVVRHQVPLSYIGFKSRSKKSVLFHKRWKIPNIFDSILIIPMTVKGESLGAYLLATRRNHAFPRIPRKMIEVITFQAAISMKNARMVSDLEKMATTDGLTGLLNHRSLQEILKLELQKSFRHPIPISLLLIDIDFFKQFNDEYGHPVGDFVLREIANILVTTVRSIDLVARYGGEEFAVVLLDTKSEGAHQMAERILKVVSQYRFKLAQLSMKVTVSIGAATYPQDVKTREELIEFADRALYESKRQGRNCVTLFHPALRKVESHVLTNRLVLSMESELRRMVDHHL